MKLNFKTFGQGDPIIILHGLFGTLDNWQTIGKQLAENYSVYLIDQRNHGKSPHDDRMDYPAMAEDLQQFMNDNWIHKAHLIGHSMGGKTVMEFALRYPDMVDKLIVVDIAPKLYKAGHDLIFEALQALDPTTIKDRKEAETVIARYIDDPGIRLFLLKNMTRRKEGGFQWKMNLPVIHKHYEKILQPPESNEQFKEPTLFIRGGNSRYIEDRDRDLIEQYFPKASIETIAGAGHWVHAEAPDQLLQLVRNFVQS